MKIEIIEDIEVEPVSLEEVKEALKITGNAHDNALSSLISDCRCYIEKATNRSVSKRKIKVTSEEELEEYELPLGPASNINATYDGNYIYEYTGGEDECPPDMKRLIILKIKQTYDIDENIPSLEKEIKNLIKALRRE